MLKIKIDDIIEKAKREGRYQELNFSAEWWEEWDKKMDEIRRDSRIKQAKSWQSAKDVWLD